MVLQVRDGGEHRDMAREEWAHQKWLGRNPARRVIILHESVECCRRAMRRWQGGCVTIDVMFAFLGVATMARREHSHSTLESHARHMHVSYHLS
jgi:hypothetical protein